MPSAPPIERRAAPVTLLPPEIEQLGPWFHNLHLPDGTQTCPGHVFGDFPAFKWRQIAPSIPPDLTGWHCLDIGCNAGFYSFELAKRGATVLGIDLDDRYLKQARWAAGRFNLQDRVRFEKMQIYDLAHPLPESADNAYQFDLVLFLGVFYHLRYPLLGLDTVCQRVKRLMLFQTLTAPGEAVFERTWDRDMSPEDRALLNEPGWPKMAFLEHGWAGDYTNQWAPNHAGVEAMLRSAGMKILARPGHEFYLCAPDPERPSQTTTWNRAEYHSATGQARPAV